MKVLLDEDVPKPLVPVIRHILKPHTVDHVYDLGWKGKIDRNLYKDARDQSACTWALAWSAV